MRRLPILAFAAFALNLSAANWPQFRGPNQDGSSPETGLPATFSKTENVKWSASLPGPAASTPAIWGDKVFVTTSEPAAKKLLGICLDAKTGKEIWKAVVSEGYQHDASSNLASPSPATDGRLVFFFYGNSVLAAYDFAGKEIWKRDLGKDYGRFGTQWTYSTSPALDGGKLYIQVLQRNHAFQFQGMDKGDPNTKNESYILALDPGTGKELWRHVRPSTAQEETLEAFSTPVFYTHNKQRLMLISGGDCLTGHDAATGRELWRWGHWNDDQNKNLRLVPSPVAGDGIAVVCAPKSRPTFGVKLGGSGNLSDSALAWTSDPKVFNSDVSTPAFYQGKFYVLDSNKHTMACVEPRSGRAIWTGEIPSKAKFEASPTAADGRIYTINFFGEVSVIRAGGDKFEVVHTADFGGESKLTKGDTVSRAGVAVANGCLFIRVADRLYCVGK